MTEDETLLDPTSAAAKATAHKIVANFDREQIDTNVALGIAGLVVKILLCRKEPDFRTRFAQALMANPDA